MLVGVIVKTSWTFVASSGGVGVGRHGQNSGLAAGRGQLAFHTICEDPRQPGAGAGHLMQHCSAAAGALQVISTLLQSVVTLSPDTGPMNSKWSAAQQTGNCELELAGAARRGEARTVFAELGGGDCG